MSRHPPSTEDLSRAIAQLWRTQVARSALDDARRTRQRLVVRIDETGSRHDRYHSQWWESVVVAHFQEDGGYGSYSDIPNGLREAIAGVINSMASDIMARVDSELAEREKRDREQLGAALAEMGRKVGEL